MATAPEASRAWLLIEHPGPWPAEPTEAEQPGRLGTLVSAAATLGVRVQLIRRPGRRTPLRPDDPRTVFVGWTQGGAPWLRQGTVAPRDPSLTGTDLADLSLADPDLAGTDLADLSLADPDLAGTDLAGAGLPYLDEPDLDLAALAAGHRLSFGEPVSEPVFLVCVNGRRDLCCARLGVPLARTLAASHPAQVWETTHVGGHKYAGNLVILPHGLYYGPVAAEQATASIEAYANGRVLSDRYRGRAGQPREVQEKEHARLAEAGSLPLGWLQ
jgi:hypothetical protein